MAEEPDGAQLSEDGNYWWDGEQWQLRESAPSAAGETAEPAEPAESGTAYVSDWFEAQGPDDLPPEVVELATEIQRMIDSDPFFADLASVDIDALGEPVE